MSSTFSFRVFARMRHRKVYGWRNAYSKWNRKGNLSSRFYPIALGALWIRTQDDQGQTVYSEIPNKYWLGLLGIVSGVGYIWHKMIMQRIEKEHDKKLLTEDIKFDYGWSGVHGGVTAKWVKSGNFVTLTGLAVHYTSHKGPAVGPIAKLPEIARPMQNVYTTGQDFRGEYVRVHIFTDGIIKIEGRFSDETHGINNWISLEGISYYTNDQELTSSI
eukprot:422146_1